MSRFFRLIVLSALLAVPLTAAAQDAAPFTIQAEEDLKPALSALYAAMYDGAEPAFVAEGADLLATADAEALRRDAYTGTPVYFLYGAGLAPQSENEDAAAFMDFAASVEGQQVLIDAGFLEDTVTITDQGGSAVEIPQPVRSLISPYGVGTYYFYAVGAGDRMVAGNFLGARGPAAEIMQRIDPRFEDISDVMVMNQREINIEEAAAMEPDLIIASTRTAWIDAVRELGIPLMLYEGETPEALKKAMQITGQALGPDPDGRARAWNRYYDWIIDTIADQTADVDEPVKVLFSGTEPLRIASGDMYQSYMIEAAGGISVSAELEGYWNDVNIEQVLNWDPDVIFIPPYGGATVEAITESEEWQVLDAVKEGRVYQMHKLVAPWDIPGPDSALGIVWMAQVLYPDQVELDCATEAKYFYNTWYDYAISDDEVAALCAK